MTSSAMQDNMYIKLVQVAIRAKHGMMRLAEQYDISPMQLLTICTMEPGKPKATNWISCLLACDASNVTGIVDRLLAQGHVSRQENPQDRRVKMITLTEKGEQLRAKILHELPAYDPGILSNLDSSQKQELDALLSLVLVSPKDSPCK